MQDLTLPNIKTKLIDVEKTARISEKIREDQKRNKVDYIKELVDLIYNTPQEEINSENTSFTKLIQKIKE